MGCREARSRRTHCSGAARIGEPGRNRLCLGRLGDGQSPTAAPSMRIVPSGPAISIGLSVFLLTLVPEDRKRDQGYGDNPQENVFTRVLFFRHSGSTAYLKYVSSAAVNSAAQYRGPAAKAPPAAQEGQVRCTKKGKSVVQCRSSGAFSHLSLSFLCLCVSPLRSRPNHLQPKENQCDAHPTPA